MKCAECKEALKVAKRYYTKDGKALILCEPCHDWYKAKGV